MQTKKHIKYSNIELFNQAPITSLGNAHKTKAGESRHLTTGLNIPI